MRGAVAKLLDEEKTPLSLLEKERVVEEVLDEVFGLGPLEPLLQDPTISDILVTTPRLVYVERAGKLFRTPVEFKDNAHLLRIIEKIVARVGRRVDESSPLVDARLPDGSRVNAAIPPVAVDGPLLSIRRFGRDCCRARIWSPGWRSPRACWRLLQSGVRARLEHRDLRRHRRRQDHAAERALQLHSGRRAHRDHRRRGRTAAAADPRGAHGNAPANVEGQGAIRIRDLVINALRMRPDRIIVGEVRGEEALDMLQAMNTGHDGSLTTIHSNTPRDAMARLEVMVGMGNANMGVRAIRQQISAALDLVVQVSRFSDGTRRVTHMTEVTGMEVDTITLQDIFLFEKTGVPKTAA
jgi:pilus assembly protein CpaF